MISSEQNVCFVTPPSQGKAVIRDYAGGLGFEADSGYILPPLDNLQMAACIQDIFKVSLIDAQAAGLSVKQLCEKLIDANISLVICELSVPTLDSDIACANIIAQHGIIVVVKIHTKEISILTKILANGSVRLCLVDECEDILSDILLGHDTRGTAQLKNGEVCIVDKPFIDDLDALPFPRRDLSLNYHYSYPKLGECTTLLSSRGCPFACRYYCPYPMTQGRKWRFRTCESVMKELAEIHQLGIKRILFRDPVFSMEPDRVMEMCTAMLDQGINLEWWCETRADLLPEDLIGLMAKAGCKGINVGVESGDPALRFSKLKRGVSDDVLKGVADKTAEVGIKLAFLLMVGFPGENRNSVLATAALLQRCRPYSIGIGFPVHHPGTQLEKDAIEKGWIVQSDYQLTDGSLPVLAGPGLSPKEMVEGRDLLLQLFNAISANNAEAEHLLMNKIQTWSQGNP